MTLSFTSSPPSDPPLPARETLPTMYDLPSEYPEEPGLADEFHIWQPQILLLTFKPPNWDRDRVFSAADMNVYYNSSHPLWHKRPDWFAAIDVPRFYGEQEDLRLSYVCWQEPVNPFIVVELLSPSSEDEDLGNTTRKPGEPATKWEVYEQILRIPYYFTFSRYTNELQAFQLVGGRYQRVPLTDGCLVIPQIELSLGLWQGTYQGLDRLWLRWRTLDGELVLLPQEEATVAREEATVAREEATVAREEATVAREEATVAREEATVAREEATVAREEANLANQKAAKLAAKLQELGIDPTEI